MKVSKIDDAKLKELARISENLATDVFGQGQGWYVSGDSDDKPPMVWDGSGDAIVDQMQDGTPYFEPETAAFIAAANPETVGAMARELVELRAQNRWVRVEDMPKRRFKPGQFGKEYLIHPHVNGNATAFFGTRITDAPLFYKYGSVLHGVTHYAELPASPEEEGK